MNYFVEIIGWIGAVLIIGAYYLNINGKLKSSSALYILSNLLGGIFFTINTLVHQAYPSMIVNIIWVIIAVAALFKKILKYF
jgi:DNA integrity scanning protein DisA with diadenylate cyclase activity